MSTASWFRRFHESAAETVLVCFPHAGGSASYFHPVSRGLSPRLDVLAIQYPGRQDRRREPCIEDIGTLANRVTEALLLQADDRPIMFLGHSMGAVVAFEVTRRLEAEGISPAALFASGRRAPSCARNETLHRESDRGLIAEVRRLGGIDPQALDDPELLNMILPAMRGDYIAIDDLPLRAWNHDRRARLRTGR